MYNVIIVEDEHIESESLRRIISKNIENASIHEASTGRKAIQLIDQLNHIDMILVDINIPLPNGKDVIEYLRRTNDDTKVIVTTANDDFDIVRSMLGLKVDDYLLKPVKQSILTDVIKKTLHYDADDNIATRELKQKVFTLIDEGDYPAWNELVFQTIDGAYWDKFGDRRQAVVDFLELLNQYLGTKANPFDASQATLKMLIKEVSTRGLTDSLYFRILQSVVALSGELFEHGFKHASHLTDFIDRAKFHIEKNLLRHITLDDIAEKSFVSACYLSRAFKKTTGTGFSTYVAKRKIKIAKSLLQFSDLQVNAIALELGYQDANYFCRIFKKETGMSPSDYRKTMAVDA
ncbi:response regulator transcription factor [Brenneria corticis]|uniref:DNA-binding response regulator n=1 Tax=Brenneria corticis TaxID=2173106 RepID=A0A2U1UB92_9GAMM|nr:helix-turn-helix domain-containing protein [Brenneria sp. CFCC 11842]PWC18834.1 DNA-binding response regulator [Brenneria sp. CFCC 11842]